MSIFLSNVNECVSTRESKEHVEGLNSKVKLQLYKSFGKEVDFKTYLHGVSDAGTRLLFQFRSGTHGLNEELGRHRGKNSRTECVLCGDECESVVHVLWEDIKKGQCPSSLFLSNVNECVSTRESKEHVEGLNSKLQLYKSFGKEVDFKTYLHGVSDAGTI